MIALDIVLKGAILLSVTFILVALLRQQSAAVRHGVWTTAFVGLALMPLGIFLMPRFEVQVNQARTDVGKVTLETVQKSVEKPVKTPQPKTTLAVQMPQRNPWIFWLNVVTSAWILGVFGVLGQILRQAWGIRKMRLRSYKVEQEDVQAQFVSIRSELKIRAKVLLLQHDTTISPMTWGTFRPVVLLPSVWLSASEDERRVALLHELAHVKRYDFLKHLLSQIASAFHWCNPLVWVAQKQMMTTRERACDDAVLRQGFSPTWYAEQLVALARKLILADSQLLKQGISMAHTSELKTRVDALLNVHQKRNRLSRPMAFATFASIALLVLVIAPIRFNFAGQTQAMTLNEALNFFKGELGASNSSTVTLFAPEQRRPKTTVSTTADSTKKPQPFIKFIPPQYHFTPEEQVLNSRLDVAKAKIELQKAKIANLQQHPVFALAETNGAMNAVANAQANVDRAELSGLKAKGDQQLEEIEQHREKLGEKNKGELEQIEKDLEELHREEINLQNGLGIARAKLLEKDAESRFRDPTTEPELIPFIQKTTVLAHRKEELETKKERFLENVYIENRKIAQIESNILPQEGKIQEVERDLQQILEGYINKQALGAQKSDVDKLKQLLAQYQGYIENPTRSNLDNTIGRLGGYLSQNNFGTIRIRVRRQDDQPILMDIFDVQVLGADRVLRTNAVGETETSATAGEHEVIVGGFGWKKKRVKVTVSQNEISYLVIKMEKEE
jgi:beta-lactamase regulating signal transducer with metallopeptidase domain